MTSRNPFWILNYVRRGPITKEQLDIKPETASAAIDKFNKAYPGLARLAEQLRRKQGQSGVSDVQES